MSPSLFDALDFRQFLQLVLADKGMTHRDLAAAIGRSESWVSYLFSGARRMDPKLVEPIATSLGLKHEESAFFAALVDEEAPGTRARKTGRAVVGALRRQKRAEADGRAQPAAGFSSWHVPAILELARCQGFRGDPTWVAATLHPPIPEAAARDALAELCALGLLVDSGGELKPGAVEAWSPADLPRKDSANLAAAELHRASLLLASEALNEFRQNERHLSTSIMAMSEDQYSAFVLRLREMERELLGVASEGEAAPELNRVYALSVALFPVSTYTDSLDQE